MILGHKKEKTLNNEACSAAGRRRSRAFTLIEMCIVLFLAGLIIVIASELYKQYQRRSYLITLNERMSTIHKAIEDYVNNSAVNPYHLLPCPADPRKASTDPQYGKAIVDTTYEGYPCHGGGIGGNVGTIGPVPVPVSGGIVRFNGSARAFPDPAPAVAGPSWGWVRHGAVPVRDLNLGDEYMTEPNGHLFIYAVSEELANLPPQPTGVAPAVCPTNFVFPVSPTNPYCNANVIPNQSHGVIDVRLPGAGAYPWTANESLLTPPGSALYVLIAPGRDGAGAYNTNGIMSPNAATGYDAHNVRAPGCAGCSVIYVKAPYAD